MLYMTECSQGRQPWSDSAPQIAFSAGICSPVSRQNVHERRLPSSRRTHDGYQFSTVEFPRDPFQKGLVSCKMQSGIVFLTVACSVWPQRWAAWLQPKAESPDECSIKDTKDFRCILRWKQTWVCFMILSSQNDFILYIHVHGTCTLLGFSEHLFKWHLSLGRSTTLMSKGQSLFSIRPKTVSSSWYSTQVPVLTSNYLSISFVSFFFTYPS